VSPNSSLLAAGANIGVPNQSHVLELLDAHNACQFPGILVTPEHNTLIDFILQFLPGHVRLRPAVCGDRPFICSRAIVNDGPNHLKVAVITAADHGYPSLPAYHPKSIRDILDQAIRQRKSCTLQTASSKAQRKANLVVRLECESELEVFQVYPAHFNIILDLAPMRCLARRPSRCPECGQLQKPGKKCWQFKCGADISKIKNAAASYRFHGLRHQAITELRENGTDDVTVMGIAHVSRKMLEHYSHTRLAAKRSAVDGLGKTSHHTVMPQSTETQGSANSQVIENIGGREGIRTPGLLVANAFLATQNKSVAA
jgi:hypothetical protein